MSILMLQLVTLSFSVQTMEPVDQLLQCVDPAKDRELWVRENKTGEVRPVDIEIWPQCYPVLTPRLTLIQELHAWGLTEFCAGFLTALTDPSVTPNRLRDDRTAPHPISFLLRMMSVFGVFRDRTLSDEWRCRIVAGHSFLGVKAVAKPRWHMETGKCELWGKWSGRTFNTCTCWIALCHAALSCCSLRVLLLCEVIRWVTTVLIHMWLQNCKNDLTDAAKQEAFWPKGVILLCTRIRLKYFILLFPTLCRYWLIAKSHFFFLQGKLLKRLSVWNLNLKWLC